MNYIHDYVSALFNELRLQLLHCMSNVVMKRLRGHMLTRWEVCHYSITCVAAFPLQSVDIVPHYFSTTK